MKFSDIKEKSDEYLSQEFGNIELTYNGFFNKLSNVIARMTYNLEEVRQKTEINDNDVYSVEGEAMDRLYSQMPDIKRKSESKARGFLSIKNSVPGTYIDTYELKVACDETGVEYTNIEPVLVDSSGVGTVQIEAMVYGNIGNVESYCVNTIVTPIYGIKSVTNQYAIEGGQDLETDSEYRARYLITRGLSVGITKDDLLRQLLRVEGLIDANIIENYEEFDQDFDVSKKISETEKLTLTKKSFAVFARGGSDFNIAKAIALKTNLSIKMYGNIEIQVYSEARQTTDIIKFYRAKNSKIFYKIKLEGKIDITALRSILKEVLTTSRVGTRVTSGKIEDRIYNELDTSRLDNLEFLFSYSKDGVFTNSLQLKNDEYISEVEEVL